MTPKEKAKELVSKLTLSSNAQDGSWMCEDLAQRCALIAVDEIIKAMDNVMLPNPFKQYWNKVKQEIQEL